MFFWTHSVKEWKPFTKSLSGVDAAELKRTPLSDELIAAAREADVYVEPSMISEFGGLTWSGALLLQAKIIRKLAEEAAKAKVGE